MEKKSEKESLSKFKRHNVKSLGQFSVTERPLKPMKNAFYFTSKAIFVIKIFRNGLIRKIRLNSNFMKSQP